MSWFTAELRRFVPNITTGITTGIAKGAEIIDTGVQTYISDPFSGYGTDIMTESQNIFSSSREYLDKLRTGVGQDLHKIGEGFDIGWRMEEGVLGLGTPNAFIPSVGGATSPNIEQFNLGDKNLQKILRLGAAGTDFHDAIVLMSRLDPVDFFDDPEGWHRDPIGKVKELWRKNIGSSSSYDDEVAVDSTPEEEYKVKGPGTLRGREATLQLNIGAKGLGRKSLRIGTKGMGKPKTGKYKTWRSGRTSLGYG